ncbi:MAG: hypothetical protein HY549_12160 [Elusimicrobia bacterium]|nr:hypothetical protein [Elusimicrobiota bacterium]
MLLLLSLILDPGAAVGVDLEPEPAPYVWTQEKRHPGLKGRYEIRTKASYRLKLPPALKREKRFFELRVADLEGLTVYHQTSFKALDQLLLDPSTGSWVSGSLNTPELRFTNPQREPAFYTHIDPVSGIIKPDAELLLKIKTRPQARAVLLSLHEPTDQSQRYSLFRRLTGRGGYLEDYELKHHKGNSYDFDLFHDALIEVLRERYRLRVDLMLYVLDQPPGFSGPERNIYTWAVFFNRRLLEGALIERVYFWPFSQVESAEPGVNDWLYAPVSYEFWSFARSRPGITEALRALGAGASGGQGPPNR